LYSFPLSLFTAEDSILIILIRSAGKGFTRSGNHIKTKSAKRFLTFALLLYDFPLIF